MNRPFYGSPASGEKLRAATHGRFIAFFGRFVAFSVIFIAMGLGGDKNTAPLLHALLLMKSPLVAQRRVRGDKSR